MQVPGRRYLEQSATRFYRLKALTTGESGMHEPKIAVELKQKGHTLTSVVVARRLVIRHRFGFTVIVRI